LERESRYAAEGFVRMMEIDKRTWPAVNEPPAAVIMIVVFV
jgi:hypothetical protein